MKNTRWISSCTLIALLAIGFGQATPSIRAAEDLDDRAVQRAHAFLKPASRGRDILSFVHFGAAYRGHTYAKTVYVNNSRGKRVPGHFGLVYDYDWEDGGETRIAFLCDAKGAVYKAQILSSNAQFSQPFVLANATVQVLGNLMIEVFKDNLTRADRAELQRLIARADAKGMMEWSLKLQQTLGR